MPRNLTEQDVQIKKVTGQIQEEDFYYKTDQQKQIEINFNIVIRREKMTFPENSSIISVFRESVIFIFGETSHFIENL